MTIIHIRGTAFGSAHRAILRQIQRREMGAVCGRAAPSVMWVLLSVFDSNCPVGSKTYHMYNIPIFPQLRYQKLHVYLYIQIYQHH